MLKKALFAGLLFFILSFKFVFAQNSNGFIVLKTKTVVGDTVDLKEKCKYNLYPQLSDLNFLFAQYIMIGDQMKLRVNFIDSTSNDLDYNLDVFIKDIDKIRSNKNRVYREPKSYYKRALIRITDPKTGKKMKLRKRKRIELKTNEYFGNSNYAVIKDIIISNEPVLKLRYVGKDIMVPLSKINYIYKRPVYEQISIKVLAVLYSTAGILGIVNDIDSAPLTVPFMTIGTVCFLLKNNKFYIDNSDIEIIYR